MKTLHLAAATLIAIALPHVAHAERIEAQLSGYSEVPSVSTPASGEFKATIARDGQSIDYELTFSGLTGTVQQSHIHIAQRGVNGSIVVWLCQTPTTPAPAAVSIATPMCPQAGTVSGTITSSSVIAASTASQLIAAGELNEVIAAIRAGVAYANVHATPLDPGGEIRGQIHADERHDQDDHDHDNDDHGRGR